MRRIGLTTFVLALALLAPSAGSATATTTQRASGLETAVVREVNAVRAARGLQALSRSSGLMRAADAHTVAMLEAGAFDHEFPGWLTFAQRLKRFFAGTTDVWSGAENIAYFAPAAPSAREIVAAWMASPPHRTNLLGKSWRELGVAVRFAPSAGGYFGGSPTWLVTLDLGRRGT